MTGSEVETLLKFAPMIVQMLVLAAYFARTEVRVKAQDERIKDMRHDHERQVLTVWAKIDSMNASIVGILQSTARVETALGLNQKE